MLNQLSLPRLRLIINSGLVVLCALLIWWLVDRAFLSDLPRGIVSEPIRPLQNTTRFSWFATQRAAVVEVVEEPSEELEDANIRAELLGIMITDDYSFAAIQTAQVPDGLYSLGDEIVNNVDVVRIESDRVVVRENGVERQIRLNPLSEDGSTDAGALIQTVPQESQGFSLAGVFGASPITVSGHGLAMRIDSLDPEFAQISGLQTRDILLNINERPISGYISNPMLLQQVLQQTLVNVAVQRDGETVELSLNARSLGERILPQLGQSLVQ